MFRYLGLLFALILMATAPHAETLPDYQPAAYRQVCTTADVLDAPGGARIGQLDAGTRVTISDLRFDSTGRDYLQVSNGDLQGFAAGENLAHFCNFTDRQDLINPRFLAPPNSCHVIVASRRTLPEVRAFASQNPNYLPMMTVFQSDNGWYAISIGPISLKAVGQVLGPSSPLPDDAYCSTGANYTAILDRHGDVFDALSDIAPDDPTELLRWNCQQGQTADCLRYNNAIWDTRPHDEAMKAELSRFDFLGCMGGHPVPCEELIKPELGGLIERAASLGRQYDADFPAKMEPELGKVSCDAGRLDGCLYLGRPALQFKTDDLAEHLTAFQAYLRMCRQVRGWVCAELVELISRNTQVVGSAFTPDDQYALAQILTPTCDRDGHRGVCGRMYSGHAAFLKGAEGAAPPDESRAATAFAALNTGCEGGSLTACVALSTQVDRADAAVRSRAAAKAIALCQPPNADAPGCSGLAFTLSPDLPETAGPLFAKYEEYAEECRTDTSRWSSNACSSALDAYRKTRVGGDLSVPEKLLRENCRPDRIAGCEALADIFDAHDVVTIGGGTIGGPGQPEQRLAALQMGCKAGTQGMSNCASLGLMQEKRGDFAAASAAYAVGCASAMFIKDPSYQGDHACFWGGEHAMKNTHDYATARRYLAFICDSNDWEMTPSACTMLGKMNAAGQGGPADLAAAMARLERGCFYDSAELADLEGCMLYGNMVMENRDHLDWNESGEGVTVAAPDHVAHGDVTAFGLSRASHAFLRACSFAGPSQEPGCTANRKLLADWSRGDYPGMARTCRVQNAAGEVTSEKPCQQFVFYVPEFMADGEGEATIYVWPDGDRTVTRHTAKGHRLNDAPVSDFTVGDDWICWTNATSGNRFCIDAIKAENEY